MGLVSAAEYPITSTSANMSEAPLVCSSKRVPIPLRSAVDLILNTRTLKRRKPSTIVDSTLGDVPIVIRTISASAIFEVLAQERKGW